VNIHFNAPLAERIPHRPIFFHRVQNERVEGVFFTTDGASRWILLVGYKPRSGESPEDFTDERAVQLIRQGSGMPDLEIDITAKKQWTTQADMATRWVEGRVFLAGDAAHRMTPLGALGMNTGIQDAHNLAWKMAAVLQGWAGTELLDTYEAERRPVAQANVNRSVELLGTGLLDVARPIPPVPSSGRTALDFDIGFEYASTAVIPDGRFDVPTGDSAAVPSSRPGCRAPHVWISHNGNRVSTLDLLGPYFTLLVDEGDTVWSRAARAVGTTTQMPLHVKRVRLSESGSWERDLEISRRGALLIRPDGHVAWRCLGISGDPAADLVQALARVLCRPDPSCRVKVPATADHLPSR
jgi:hypothetical protein